MEWVFIIGAVFIVLVIFSVKAENKKNKIKEEQGKTYSAEIETARQSLLTSSETASMPVLSAADYGYRPVAKERGGPEFSTSFPPG